MTQKTPNKQDKVPKEPRSFPKCIYADWKYCWQRNTEYKTYNSYQLYYVINESKCAACLAAHINWGDGATRRPLTKEEIQKEKEGLKIATTKSA